MEKKLPIRTCISCREPKPKKELLRIVRNKEGQIFLDKTGKANGRGAYICNDIKCFEKLKKAKLLNRIFACQIEEEIYNQIAEAFVGKEE